MAGENSLESRRAAIDHAVHLERVSAKIGELSSWLQGLELAGRLGSMEERLRRVEAYTAWARAMHWIWGVMILGLAGIVVRYLVAY